MDVVADRAFEALADPTRRRIVELLAAGERTAGEIADQFPVSRPAISRHLRVLRETGLVRYREEAQRRVYALEPAPLVALDAWLARYRVLWPNRLDALDTEIARGTEVARGTEITRGAEITRSGEIARGRRERRTGPAESAA